MLEQLKLNVKNKAWWVSIVSLLILLAQRFGLNLTDYIGSNWQDTLNTIFSILVLLGISVDTTTQNLGVATNNGFIENEIQEKSTSTNTSADISSNSTDVSVSGMDGSISSQTDDKNAIVVNNTIRPKEPTV
ncbi:bacteriophage holin [Clostridium saccharobutylicum]|uniref:phage holin n=1 Tax=Clostridium saccharobutylicum TaxID=169679 RepID=UPI000983CF14|nr:phage holin [Clostridium saccharobutylicum]AQS09700.1 bacteriophage holin [Clostridium saccharobutylicum]MBC2436906.1 hypothetical protein [Clostridium saccharobutylicum]NSB89254.1 phi LC3 family holin [Clostridium saccharobutylicum]NYC27908.1 phi LC3 family holin [Clostridium saccharobutylicum]OOM17105.1 bacteriophage holin [Clostridium saccharobutylicum]